MSIIYFGPSWICVLFQKGLNIKQKWLLCICKNKTMVFCKKKKTPKTTTLFLKVVIIKYMHFSISCTIDFLKNFEWKKPFLDDWLVFAKMPFWTLWYHIDVIMSPLYPKKSDCSYNYRQNPITYYNKVNKSFMSGHENAHVLNFKKCFQTYHFAVDISLNDNVYSDLYIR